MKNNKKHIYRLLSFFISISFIVLIFLINKMNGKEYLVMRSDFLDSIGYYKDFSRNILTHNSIFFNYSSGLGLNNIMAVSGLLNPFNLLYLLFYKYDYDVITAIIIVLKIGFSALSFQFFSERIIKNKSFFSVIISVFYSLNAYSIEYGTIQVAWLDSLIIIPLICASIIECIEHKKRVNIIILYSYLFISNFYMGYIIGFFTLLFVILYVFLMYKKQTNNHIKECVTLLLNWLLCVLIAVMLSSFIWVPTLFFLASNRVPDSTEIVELKVSIFQILNSLFWGMDYGIEGTYSYIYCGIPVYILSILFFINHNIEKKLKWFYGLLILVIIISMISNRLNSFWHVFDQPDDFWYRYSFLLCFCLCSSASYVITVFEKNDRKNLIYVVFSLSLLYQFALHTSSLWELDHGIQNTNYGFIINFGLIVFWSFALYLICENKYSILVYIFSFAILSFEILLGSRRMFNNLIESETYHFWTESVENVSNEIQNNDNGFYRTIFANNDTSYNSDIMFGLKGIEDFGNQEKYSVRKFLSNVGFATSPRVTLENGFNPVSEMILGIKYEINAPECNFYNNSKRISTLIDYDTNEEISLSDSVVDSSSYNLNNYALNLGYMVDGNILLYEYSGRNVFENMNEIVSTLSGKEENCYIPVAMDNLDFDSVGIDLIETDENKFVFSRTDTEGQMVISVPRNGYYKAYIQFEKDKTGIYGIDYYIIDAQNAPNVVANRLGLSSSIQMNSSDDNDRFISTIGSFEGYSPEIFECDNINIYYLDEEALKNQFEELSRNQLNVSQYSNGHIEGTIHVDGYKRLLFTTIPYDPGWKAYINGIETEPIRVIDGTFMGIFLPSEGDFDIVLDFECPGLKIGIIVSIGGLLALLSVIFENKLKNFRIQKSN